MFQFHSVVNSSVILEGFHKRKVMVLLEGLKGLSPVLIVVISCLTTLTDYHFESLNVSEGVL